MADDLVDDWYVQEDINENSDCNDQLKESNTERETKQKKKVTSEKKKRKLKDRTNQGTNTPDTVDESIAKKKKKKKKKTANSDETSNLPSSVDALWSHFEKELAKNLTSLEINDIKPANDKWFLVEKNIERKTDNLSKYLGNVILDWKEKCKEITQNKQHGAPVLIVISPAAVRAVDVLRATSDFRGEDCRTAKLFAKHMKIDEQLTKLKSSVVHLAVGTPNRLLKLVEGGGIKVKKVKYVVLDWSWKDVKERSITTMPGVKDDLLSLLQNYIFPRCKKKKLSVGCF